MKMKANIWDGEIRIGPESIWVSFEGKVQIDGTIWNAHAQGDESLRGVEWELSREVRPDPRGKPDWYETEEIRFGPAMPDLSEWEREASVLLDEYLDNLSIFGGEVLKGKPDHVEMTVLFVRTGRVVAGCNIPIIGSPADTFGPEWAR